MRFAAGSSISSYIAAGRNAASAAASLQKTARQYSPDYGAIAEEGIVQDAKDFQTMVDAKKGLAQTKMQVDAKMRLAEIDAENAKTKSNMQSGLRKAGAIAAAGKFAAAGLQKPIERPEFDDGGLRDFYTKKIAESEAAIAELRSKPLELFDPDKFRTPTSSDTPSSGDSPTSGGNATPGNTDTPSEYQGLSGNQKYVADMVAGPESGSSGYEAFNQGGTNAGRGVVGKSGSHKELMGRSLTDMTLSEIFDKQNTKQKGMSMQQHLDSGGLHAVGRYQFIGPTLQDEVSKMGLSLDTKFTPEVQDQIFLSHIKRVGNISPWIGPSDKYSSAQKAELNNMIAGF